MRRWIHIPCCALMGLSVGCTDTDLIDGDDGAGGHQGTTLPGPDMTKVSFTADPLVMEIVILGSPAAVPAGVLVEARNETTSTTDTTTAAPEGSFVLTLTDSQPGDDVTLAIENDEGERSEAAAIELDTTVGEHLPVPHEVQAVAGEPGSGTATVSGVLPTTAALWVRIANRNTGRVDHAETEGVDARPFSLIVPADPGHEIMVSAFEPEVPAVSGPFVQVVVEVF